MIQNLVVIFIAIFIVTLNGLIGHFYPPNGIVWTPLVISISTYLVAFRTTQLNPIIKSLLAFIFIALNDILLKLYVGGTHDNEGLAYILFFLYLGLIPTSGIILTSVITDKQTNIASKIISLVLFPALIVAHLYLFSNLGLGREYPIN